MKEETTTTGVMSGQARVIALLQDENEQLRAERNRDAIAGQAALDEANNEIVLLRAALETVEWMNEFDNDAPRWCPWCDRWQHDGHSPNCQRQAALSKKAP